MTLQDGIVCGQMDRLRFDSGQEQRWEIFCSGIFLVYHCRHSGWPIVYKRIRLRWGVLCDTVAPMNLPAAHHLESSFMMTNGSLFNSRFVISYFRENACIEYFIKNRISSETISSSLVFSYNPTKKDLHVSRFYPELYLQSSPRYMSSVCFGFLINHCAETYCLDGACHISLETVPVVCDAFYRKLKDFNFHITKYGLGNVVELESDIRPLFMDTSLIKKHIYSEGELPFMK